MHYIPFGDYHLHTRYSDGQATIFEMALEAQKMGLKEIAITDHGPRNIGTGVKSARTFLEIKEEVALINKKFPDLKILVGAEANVISSKGDIDIPEEIYKKLDILIIGLHPFAIAKKLLDIWKINIKNLIYNYSGIFKKQVLKENTFALKNAILRHKPFAISHPGLKMPIDIAEIALVCAKTGTFFEINTGHNYQTPQEIKTAASWGVNFIVGSDAHSVDTLGKLDSGFKLLKEAGVDYKKIINFKAPR